VKWDRGESGRPVLGSLVICPEGVKP